MAAACRKVDELYLLVQFLPYGLYVAYCLAGPRETPILCSANATHGTLKPSRALLQEDCFGLPKLKSKTADGYRVRRMGIQPCEDTTSQHRYCCCSSPTSVKNDDSEMNHLYIFGITHYIELFVCLFCIVLCLT